MAFTKLTGKMSKAFSMGNKKVELKTVEGFLLGVKIIDAKKKGQKASVLYKFTGKKGERTDVWGGAMINSVCLTDSQKLSKDVAGRYVQFNFVGMLPAKKGQNAGRNVEVGVDNSVKMPKGLGRIKF